MNQKNIEVFRGVSFLRLQGKRLSVKSCRQVVLVLDSKSLSCVTASFCLVRLPTRCSFLQCLSSYYCVFVNLAPTILDKKCQEFCFFLPTEGLSRGFGSTMSPPPPTQPGKCCSVGVRNNPAHMQRPFFLTFLSKIVVPCG